MKNNKIVKNKIIRIIFVILGLISFILGTIGIFLPILPTVPLYLLTAFLWVRGSEKFSNWFLNSKLYKKHMNTFANHKVMIWWKEIILLVLVTALLLVTMIKLNVLAMNIIFPILIACKYGYFVFNVKPISRKEYVMIREEDLKKYEFKTVGE